MGNAPDPGANPAGPPPPDPGQPCAEYTPPPPNMNQKLWDIMVQGLRKRGLTDDQIAEWRGEVIATADNAGIPRPDWWACFLPQDEEA